MTNFYYRIILFATGGRKFCGFGRRKREWHEVYLLRLCRLIHAERLVRWDYYYIIQTIKELFIKILCHPKEMFGLYKLLIIMFTSRNFFFLLRGWSRKSNRVHHQQSSLWRRLCTVSGHGGIDLSTLFPSYT